MRDMGHESKETSIVFLGWLGFVCGIFPYGFDNGVPGLTLALDGLYGNKIKLKNFQSTESAYSGTLEFTFYDHFGLDTPDLADEKYGNLTAGTLPGFRQWFILQHWNELEGTVQPKPFVTNISFSIPISGVYE